MAITATSASPAGPTTSTASTESSRYTAIVDQHVKALTSGSTASFDEKLKAWGGLLKLLTRPIDSSGTTLYQINKKDTEKANESLMNSDMLKQVWAAEERFGRAQKAVESDYYDKLDRGDPVSREEMMLKAFNKVSIDDQKLVFASWGNHSLDENISTEEFASVDDYKTFLRTKADAFARQPASQPAANGSSSVAPEASSASGAPSKADNGKSQRSKTSGKSQGVAKLTAKLGLAAAQSTAGMINAAVALQVLQAASEANKASTVNGPAQHPKAAVGTDNTASQPRNQEPSITLRV